MMVSRRRISNCLTIVPMLLSGSVAHAVAGAPLADAVEQKNAAAVQSLLTMDVNVNGVFYTIKYSGKSEIRTCNLSVEKKLAGFPEGPPCL